VSDDSISRRGSRTQGTSSPALEAARLRRYHQALVRLAGAHETLFGDLEGALREITEMAARTLGVERVGIWRFTKGWSLLRSVDLYELSVDHHSCGAEIRVGEAPEYLGLLKQGNPLSIEDAEADPRSRPLAGGYLAPLGITSTLEVPVRLGEEIIGFVRHEHVGAPRQWIDEERDFATSVGAFTSVAYEADARSRATDRTKARAEEHAAVIEIAKLALSGTRVRDLQKRAAELLARTLRTPFCQISDFESDGPALRLRAGVGWRQGSIGVARIGTESGSYFDSVRAAGGTLVSSDHATDERFRAPDLLANHSVTAGVSVLMGDPNRPVGLLGVYARNRRDFSIDEVGFLVEVADILALAGRRSETDSSADTGPPTEGSSAGRLFSRVRQAVQKTREQVAAPPRRRGVDRTEPPPRRKPAPSPEPQAAPEEASHKPAPEPTPRPAARPDPKWTVVETPKPHAAPPEPAPPKARPAPPKAKPAAPKAAPAQPKPRRAAPEPAPLEEAELDEVLDLEEAAPEEEEKPAKPRRRVLVAEQTMETQRVMRNALERAGFEVVMESEGQAAAEAALIALRHGQAFDLALVDVQLPVLDGFGVVRRLREGGFRGPVVAVISGPTDRARCLAAGFDECTEKPVESARLIGCVTRQLDKAPHGGLG
jgi:CheY-like chemotaxis protein/GAF domain-containing protein